MNHIQPRHGGMTLIEVLAVVVILGLLATTLTIGLSGRIGKARHEIARTQIAQIASALETFRLDKRRLPTSNEGLSILTVDPRASYHLEKGKLADPWDNAYLYIVPGPDGLPYEVVSYGSDGQPGGSGDEADLSSANLSGKE
jgi:general secretion pathway protein G